MKIFMSVTKSQVIIKVRRNSYYYICRSSNLVETDVHVQCNWNWMVLFVLLFLWICGNFSHTALSPRQDHVVCFMVMKPFIYVFVQALFFFSYCLPVDLSTDSSRNNVLFWLDTEKKKTVTPNHSITSIVTEFIHDVP